MAGEDDEIVVTIEGENPEPQDEIVKLNDETTGKKSASAGGDDIVGSLKAQLAERQGALDTVTQRASSAEAMLGQANQRTRQLEQEVTDARTQVAESTKSTLESGIAAAKAESQSAQDALTAAFDAGDGKGLAVAQRRVSRAEAELTLLENTRFDPAPVEKRQPQQELRAADPIETFISQHSPRTQSWMREHKDYVTDKKKNARMVAAHWSALAEDLVPDSDAYFEHVEKSVGLKKDAATQQQDPQHIQRRPTAPVAPVTPSGGGMGGGVTEVRLSASEAKAAQDGTHQWNYDDPTGKARFKKGDPIGVQEFARRKSIMTKEGRYQNISADGT